MTPEKRKDLQWQLVYILKVNDFKPTTKRAKDIAWAYWLGVLNATDDRDPYVTLCLVSGRVDELMKETT